MCDLNQVMGHLCNLDTSSAKWMGDNSIKLLGILQVLMTLNDKGFEWCLYIMALNNLA